MIKKMVCALLCAVLLAALLGVPAMATERTAAAEALTALGLFNGSDQGPELDREPKRVEAAVMLVRLLGKEAEARAGTYSHPFRDVPGWAAPHIGYLYENGLINGVLPNEFGSESLCTAKMYATLVLRALGYSDLNNVDFAYKNALDFAAQIGLVDKYNINEPFTRGDMASLSYTALFIELKNSEFGTLLEQLTELHAVPEDIAGQYLKRYALLTELKGALAGISETKTADASINLSCIAQAGDEILNLDYEITVKVNIDGEVPQMAVNLKMRMPDGIPENGYNPDSSMDISTDIYYLDRYLYVNYDGERFKSPLDPEEFMGEIAYSFNADGILPFQVIGEIDKQTVETMTLYTLSIPVDAALFETLLFNMNNGEGSEEPFVMVLQFTADADGNISRITGSVDMNIETETDGTPATITVSFAISIDLGVPVAIDPPDDLDTYEEIDDTYVLSEDLLNF